MDAITDHGAMGAGDAAYSRLRSDILGGELLPVTVRDPLARPVPAAVLLAVACNPFSSSPPPTTRLPAAYRPSPPAHRGETLVFSD